MPACYQLEKDKPVVLVVLSSVRLILSIKLPFISVILFWKVAKQHWNLM